MLGLKAQDKYEYASVVYRNSVKDKAMIETSIGDKYTETQVAITQSKVGEDLTPVITFLNKLGNEGWEVYSVYTPPTVPGICYSLRRRK